MKCQHCGHKLTPGAAFCGNCGTPVPQAEVAPQSTAPTKTSVDTKGLTVPTPPPVASPEQPLPQMPGPSNPFAGQVSDKSYITTFLLAFFLGIFGVDRFYTGQIGLGIAKLAFGWTTIGVWPLIDVILILTGTRKDKFGRPLYGRDKDFKASLLIFIVISTLVIVGNVIAGVLAVLSSEDDLNKTSTGQQDSSSADLIKPLGSTITLTDTDGYRFEMTAVKLTANAQPVYPDSYAAPAGKQLVTVELRIKAGSDGSISENATSSARLFDSQNYAYAPDSAEIVDCPSFPEGYIEINHDETLNGCLAFLVPTDAKIDRFRFLPYSELSDQAATWTLKQ